MDPPRRQKIRRRAANSRRAAHIAAVLARHGMGSLARAAGSLRRARHDDTVERPITAARYAAVASELGVAFVRLAHALSLRADLFSADERAAPLRHAAREIDPEAMRDARRNRCRGARLMVGDLLHRVHHAGCGAPTAAMSSSPSARGGRHRARFDILRPAARLLACAPRCGVDIVAR
jgi:hypothetical protein